MEKTLTEINQEISNLEVERNKENMNRINNMAALWNAQEKFGGNFFGILISKEVQNFDNKDYENLFLMINKKIRYLEGIYSKKDIYDETSFLNETKGVSIEDFNAAVTEIRSGMSAIKSSNSKLTSIWNREAELGKKNNTRKEKLEFYSNRIKQINTELEEKSIILANNKNYKAEKEAAGLLSKTDTDWLNTMIQSDEEVIKRLKEELDMIYSKKATKEEIEIFEAQRIQEQVEAKIQEENELNRQEAEAKKQAFAEVRAKKEQTKLDAELDASEKAYFESQKDQEEVEPQEASINSESDNEEEKETLTSDSKEAEEMMTPEPAKKAKSIVNRAGTFFQKIVDNKAIKTIAVTVACAAAIAAGMAWAPGLMLGGAALYGYEEYKKGIGK